MAALLFFCHNARMTLRSGLVFVVLAAAAFAVVKGGVFSLAAPRLDAVPDGGGVRIVARHEGQPVGMRSIVITEVMGGWSPYEAHARDDVFATGLVLRPGYNPVRPAGGEALSINEPVGGDKYLLRRNVLYRVRVCASTGMVGTSCSATDIRFGSTYIR